MIIIIIFASSDAVVMVGSADGRSKSSSGSSFFFLSFVRTPLCFSPSSSHYYSSSSSASSFSSSSSSSWSSSPPLSIYHHLPSAREPNLALLCRPSLRLLSSINCQPSWSRSAAATTTLGRPSQSAAIRARLGSLLGPCCGSSKVAGPSSGPQMERCFQDQVQRCSHGRLALLINAAGHPCHFDLSACAFGVSQATSPSPSQSCVNLLKGDDRPAGGRR